MKIVKPKGKIQSKIGITKQGRFPTCWKEYGKKCRVGTEVVKTYFLAMATR